MENKKIFIDVPTFTGENVPISLVAKVMRKDPQYVRQGLVQGYLPIGKAFIKEGRTQYDYYVSPKLLWEYTGFYYDPEKNYGSEIVNG